MLKEYKQETLELMHLLVEEQENCAPIRLSIGYTQEDTNTVRQGILLLEAPPVVIEKLIQSGYVCDLTERGILVYKL